MTRRKKREPVKVQEVTYEGGMFIATCRSCVIECRACGVTIEGALDSLPCSTETRERVAIEGDGND